MHQEHLYTATLLNERKRKGRRGKGEKGVVEDKTKLFETSLRRALSQIGETVVSLE
jgi:hypothetical protein